MILDCRSGEGDGDDSNNIPQIKTPPNGTPTTPSRSTACTGERVGVHLRKQDPVLQRDESLGNKKTALKTVVQEVDATADTNATDQKADILRTRWKLKRGR